MVKMVQKQKQEQKQKKQVVKSFDEEKTAPKRPKAKKGIKIAGEKWRNDASTSTGKKAGRDASASGEIMKGKTQQKREKEEHYCACVSHFLRGGKPMSHGPLYKRPKSADTGNLRSSRRSPIFRNGLHSGEQLRHCACAARAPWGGTGVQHGTMYEPEAADGQTAKSSLWSENGCRSGVLQPLEEADCSGDKGEVKETTFRRSSTSAFQPYKKYQP